MRDFSPRRYAFLALFAALAVGAHAQTAVSSSVNAGAFADADTGDGISASDSQTNAQGASIALLAASAFAADTLAVGDSVSVFAGIRATWVDAGEGTVVLSQNGWTFNTSQPTTGYTNTNLTTLPAFTYTFEATEDGTFDLEFDTNTTGDPFGLQGFNVNWSGPGGGMDFIDAFAPPAAGSFTRSLLSGEQYTVSINTNSNISGEFGLSGLAGNFSSEIRWKVNAVPEPATTVALALCAVGLMRRRKYS